MDDIIDGKAGFAFVRDDGAVMLVCPVKDNTCIKAYWLSEDLLSALAAEQIIVPDRLGGTWGHDTLTKIDNMCIVEGFRLRCSIVKSQVPCIKWEGNHGTPWGEGPPSKSCWPLEPNGKGKLARVRSEKRREIFANAMRQSEVCHRCDMDFHDTTQAGSRLLVNRSNPPYGDLAAPLAGFWVDVYCGPSAQAAYQPDGTSRTPIPPRNDVAVNALSSPSPTLYQPIVGTPYPVIPSSQCAAGTAASFTHATFPWPVPSQPSSGPQLPSAKKL